MGKKTSKDLFIPQASIPTFELEKKGKAMAGAKYRANKKKINIKKPAKKSK